MIYTNDHEPPHVHVVGAGKLAIFNLEDGAVSIRANIGMRAAELRRIRPFLVEHMADLQSAWRQMHGKQ